MDLKSKFLIAVFLLAVIAAVAWKYHNTHIEQDFLVHDYVSCDPEIESCFVYCEEGECEEDPYKKITKNAATIPLCHTYEDDTCEPLTCAPNEVDCEVTNCSEDTLEEGEECYVPEPEEESMEDEFIEEEIIDSEVEPSPL